MATRTRPTRIFGENHLLIPYNSNKAKGRDII